MNMFYKDDVVRIKDSVSSYNYSDLIKGTEYRVKKVKDDGKILLKGQYSTNYYTPNNFVLVKRASSVKMPNLLVTEYPNIGVLVGGAESVDEAKELIGDLLKKNPLKEYAILGVIDRAKLQIAPIQWATEAIKTPNPIDLHENSEYTKPVNRVSSDVTIVGTLKDRLKQRS